MPRLQRNILLFPLGLGRISGCTESTQSISSPSSLELSDRFGGHGRVSPVRVDSDLECPSSADPSMVEHVIGDRKVG